MFKTYIQLVKQMLTEDEFMFPYVWAQRQYRKESYKMAATALLEDLFFDTFGTFLRQRGIKEQWARRTGSESWDFLWGDLPISHKEGQQPQITAWWTSGEGSAHRELRRSSHTFEHPVEFVYTPLKLSLIAQEQKSGRDDYRTLRLRSLDYQTIQAVVPSKSLVLLSKQEGNQLIIARMWDYPAFQELSLVEIREQIGLDKYGSHSMWVTTQFESANDLKQAQRLQILKASEPSGVYFFPADELADLPLKSNNRAHMVAKPVVQELMKSARNRGDFAPLPLWPTIYANMQPANLYAIQRRQYDELLAPRQR